MGVVFIGGTGLAVAGSSSSTCSRTVAVVVVMRSFAEFRPLPIHRDYLQINTWSSKW